MSQKAVREFDGKRIVADWLSKNTKDTKTDWVEFGDDLKVAQVGPETDLDQLPVTYSWLLTDKLVAKPDQLIKRRGKAGLIKLNATFEEVKIWIQERRNKAVKIGSTEGILTHFVIEPFAPHAGSDEYYVCIHSLREGDEILFYHEGGVDIGDVDAKASRCLVKVMTTPTEDQIAGLIKQVPDSRREKVGRFVTALFECYCALNFAYLEINPLVFTEDQIHILDMAAKLDETARFECHSMWGDVEFPPPFGRVDLPEEQFIQGLDEKTGASLKLTVLNPKGRVWTLVAGGGASVVYADTIADLGAGDELGNYGEYSGNPTADMTYQYVKTILGLMGKHKHPDGKLLIVGGGIANFTDIAATFKGIVRAFKEMRSTLVDHKTQIFVRRGGPNYQEGLRMMRESDFGVPCHVFGPETHMTSIVAMALGKLQVPEASASVTAQNSVTDSLMSIAEKPKNSNNSTTKDNVVEPPAKRRKLSCSQMPRTDDEDAKTDDTALPNNMWSEVMATPNTTAIIYGMQVKAVQNMLDFDVVSKRQTPSVSAIVYPFAAGTYYRQFYWNNKEIMVPVYPSIGEALKKHQAVDTVVNFASARSAYKATMAIMEHEQIRNITIIAEGVPERKTRHMLNVSREKRVRIIGPATVGGLKPGSFRIGNTGGMLDNIIASRLYRPGSVAYVSKSGGLSNELNNIISRNADGIYEGVAIGGDMYPIATFLDQLLRYENDPKVKLSVLLGEVGGTLEYDVIDAIKDGRLKKPIVAWCTGTVASYFTYDVQFGHAGACAGADRETAAAKNKALREAGCIVPNSFEDFGAIIKQTFDNMVAQGKIVPVPTGVAPKIPIDYNWAKKLGLIRKPAGFLSTISDERGDELNYAGMPISKVFEEDMGLGGVIGLLWFKRKLPKVYTKFIEMALMITADHGPAVSGAHNTIVTARAGKDLISSLVSGLLTIGPRFGGALDSAAKTFSWAYDSGLSPIEFVKEMQKKKKLIMGIGHKIKSLENPDKRVEIVVDYAKKHFESTPVLDYALAVQAVTTRKKSNLILNVDGAIAAIVVDMLRSCGSFTKEEADEYVAEGALNGLFVLGRSIGFMGHFLDQRRLKQGLYRHPTDDIAYMTNQL